MTFARRAPSDQPSPDDKAAIEKDAVTFLGNKLVVAQQGARGGVYAVVAGSVYNMNSGKWEKLMQGRPVHAPIGQLIMGGNPRIGVITERNGLFVPHTFMNEDGEDDLKLKRVLTEMGMAKEDMQRLIGTAKIDGQIPQIDDVRDESAPLCLQSIAGFDPDYSTERGQSDTADDHYEVVLSSDSREELVGML